MKKNKELSINQRLALAIIFLKNEGFIYNETDFCQKTGIGRSFLSDMKSSGKSISEKTVIKITTTFPMISYKWLLTGEGTMVRTIERFYKYLEHKGIGDIEASKILGWGKLWPWSKLTSLQMTKADPKLDTTWKRSIDRILMKFPDINREWLLTGEGNMIVESENTHNAIVFTIPGSEKDGIDFYVRVTDSTLLPKYKIGDTIACKAIGKMSIKK